MVLFLFQLEMDSQLQRALTYENFDAAREVRRGCGAELGGAGRTARAFFGCGWLAVDSSACLPATCTARLS